MAARAASGGRGQLQRPLLPPEPGGRRARRARRPGRRSTTSPGATPRTGCSTRPTSTGECSPRRAARSGPSPTSAPTGSTSSTPSPAWRSRRLRRPADDPRPSPAPAGGGRDVPGARTATAGEPTGGRRHRRLRLRAAPLRGRGAGDASGSRRSPAGRKNRLRLRDCRVDVGPGLGQRTAQRTLARPARRAPTASAQGPGPRRRIGPRGHSTTRAGTPRAFPTASSKASAPSTGYIADGRLRRPRRRSRRSPTATAKSCCARRSSGAIGKGAGSARGGILVKLGFVSAILPDLSLEEVSRFAAGRGLRLRRADVLAARARPSAATPA